MAIFTYFIGLEEPTLHSLRELVEGFFGYIFSEPERIWMEPGI